MDDWGDFPFYFVLEPTTDNEYIVVHEGTVIERITARYADEARERQQMTHGVLYIRCGH